MRKNVKIVLFANSLVGQQVIKFINDNYRQNLLLVVTPDGEVSEDICSTGDLNVVSWRYLCNNLDIFNKLVPDYFILAWWPYIFKKELIEIPSKGAINFHPSYLPYNRGKNYNFWSLVEDTPFGVTLHFIDEGIDTGDILFQRRIPKDWTDTGESLFNKAQETIFELFKDHFEDIINDNYIRRKQSLDIGSFHYGFEMEEKSFIEYDKEYLCKDLLNVIRARTFPSHPSCRFKYKGKNCFITLKILRCSFNEVYKHKKLDLSKLYSLHDLFGQNKDFKNIEPYLFMDNSNYYKILFTVFLEERK